MKNGLSDLNNHLFAQMERLGSKDLTQEQIEQESKRASAMVEVSDQIISNATLQLNAAKLFAEHGKAVLPMLPRVAGKSDDARQIEGEAK